MDNESCGDGTSMADSNHVADERTEEDIRNDENITKMFHNLFTLHQNHVECYRTKLNNSKRRCTKQAKEIDGQQEKIRELQKKNERVKTDLEKCTLELDKLRESLSSPCAKCLKYEREIKAKENAINKFNNLLQSKREPDIKTIVTGFLDKKLSQCTRGSEDELASIVDQCIVDLCMSQASTSARPLTQSASQLQSLSVGTPIGAPLSTSTQRHPLSARNQSTLLAVTQVDTMPGHPRCASTQLPGSTLPMSEIQAPVLGASQSQTGSVAGSQERPASVITIDSSQASSPHCNDEEDLPDGAGTKQLQGHKDTTEAESVVIQRSSTVRTRQVTPHTVRAGGDATRTSHTRAEEEDVSPDSRRRLQLKGANKRSRIKYIEEPLPENKRVRLSTDPEEISPARPSSSKAKHSLLDSTQVEDENRAAPVLAPQTMGVDVSFQQSEASYEEGQIPERTAKKGKEKKPSIIVPETMPMDYDDNYDEDEADKENTSSPETSANTQDTVVRRSTSHKHNVSTDEVLTSPPSQFSTPLPSHNAPRLNHKDLVQSPHSSIDLSADERSAAKEVTAQAVDTRRRSSTQSDAGSPVFGAPATNAVIRANDLRHVRSPSLFDEESRNEEDDDRTVDDMMSPSVIKTPKNILSKTHRKGQNTPQDQEASPVVRKAQGSKRVSIGETSVVGSPSPSVLSGRTVSMLPQKEPSPVKSIPIRTSPRKPQSPVTLNKRRSPRKSSSNVRPIRKSPRKSPSPKKASKIKPIIKKKTEIQFERSSPTNNASKKLKQTKISKLAFNTKRSVELCKVGDKYLDQTIDADEERMMKEATEASLKTYQQESNARMITVDLDDCEIIDMAEAGGKVQKQGTFKKPATPKQSVQQLKHKQKVSSTRRKVSEDKDDDLDHDMTVDSEPHNTEKHGYSETEDYHHDGNGTRLQTLATMPQDFNATINPNLRLSQFMSQDDSEETYETAPSGPQYQEPTDIWDMESSKDSGTLKASQSQRSRPSRSKPSSSRSYDNECDSQDGMSGTRRSSRLRSSQESNSSRSSQESQSSRKSQSGPKKRSQQRSQESVEVMDESMVSAVFGPASSTVRRAGEAGGSSRASVQVLDSCPEEFNNSEYKDVKIQKIPIDTNYSTMDDSFDRVPKKKDPEFAYKEVVRKRADRQKLKAFACDQCADYFGGLGYTDEQIEQHIQNSCKHRAQYIPPSTPDHFWDEGFPDTQECDDRGLMNRTQARPSRYRRRRGYRQLFDAAKGSADNNSPNDEASEDSDVDQ